MAESCITRIQWDVHINISNTNVIYNYLLYTNASWRGCKTVLESVLRSKVIKEYACLRS